MHRTNCPSCGAPLRVANHSPTIVGRDAQCRFSISFACADCDTDLVAWFEMFSDTLETL